jgi:hypothetical protein
VFVRLGPIAETLRRPTDTVEQDLDAQVAML